MPPVISDVACAKSLAESRQGFTDRSGRVTAALMALDSCHEIPFPQEIR